MTIQPANSISWSGGAAVLPDEQLGVQKLDDAMNVLTDLLSELELEFTEVAPLATKKDAKSTGTLDTALSVLHQQLAELENDLRKRSQVAESVSRSLDLASTQPAIVQETSHLKVGDNREILAKVLPSPPQPTAICQRSQSPSGWTWRLPPGTQQFVPSPRHSMTNSPGALAARQPRGQVLLVQQQAQVPQTMPLQRSSTPVQVAPKDAWSKPMSPAQAMANAAISATANLAPTVPATAPVLGRALSPAPGVGARPTPAPFVPASSCWRSPSEGRVGAGYGIRPDMAQSPMRRRQEEMQSPASRQGFRSPSPRQSGRGGTPGFGTTTTSPCNISRAGRSPSEGRVTYGGSVPRGAWARGDPRSSFRREATTGAHSFNLCQSTSMTSHPSFASQSVMGGGGFNTAPAPAASYIVDLADPIDQMLGNALRSLDAAAASKLMLRRLAPGRYEIDGRKVTVRWSEQGSGLVAIEDEVLDPRGSAMPLRAYLGQAGNVVASLSGQRADMPKIARVPKSQRLTFDDKQAEKNLAAQIEKLGSERCESMRLAVEQARLREEAAEAYEKLTQGFAPSRILAPSTPAANRMSL